MACHQNQIHTAELNQPKITGKTMAENFHIMNA